MQRRFIVMLAMAGALILCGALLNYLLNPYGVWRTTLIDPVFRKPKDEHVALPYAIRSADLTTLLIGTSRVVFGMRIDGLAADGIVNGGIRAASLRESCATVDAALGNPHLKRIVWGVDFFQFNGGWDPANPEFDRRLEGGAGPMVEDTLLSFAALDNGFSDLKRMVRGRGRLPATARREVPWPIDVICSEFGAERGRGLVKTADDAIVRQLSVNMPNYQNFSFAKGFWTLFRDTIERAQRRGLDVIMFIPPMSAYELEMIRRADDWEQFERWKRRLVTLGPVADFSGYNRLAYLDEYYTDVMHHKTPVGESILRLLVGMKMPACYRIGENLSSAMVRLDGGDIDRAIAGQDGMMREASTTSSHYGKLAEAALADQRARATARKHASVIP